MKFLTIALLTLAAQILVPNHALAVSQHTPRACSTDADTMERIEEAREDKDFIEIKLSNADNQHVGSIFANWTEGGELYGQTIYLCSKGDNYFYLKDDDLRTWVGEESELITVSVMSTNQSFDVGIIHHDEALANVTVETLALDKKSASVRIIFQAWNFASEISTTGIFNATIPLKK